jgi:hypothetical protein
MNARVLAQTNRSAPSAPPALSNLLQRKCACGGTPGPTGECAECRRKRLAFQRKVRNAKAQHNNHPARARPHLRARASSPSGRASSPSPIGHDFNRIAVRPERRRMGQPGKSMSVTPEDQEKEKPSPKQGSATIQCNGSGGYEILYGGWGGATCGTKDCVTTHESSHMADWQAKWPTGCAGQPKGYLPKGDPPDNPLISASDYKSFLKASECKAHTADLACAEALAKPAACEKTVEDYVKLTRDQRSHWCGSSLGARVGLILGGAAAGAGIGALLGGGLGALIGAGVGLVGGIIGSLFL